MPLLLTTPLDMGAVDVDYTHVKVIAFSVNLVGDFLEISVAHGTEDGEGDFIVGKRVGGVTHKGYELRGADYVTILSKVTSAAGVLIYDEVARELYQWLIDNGHFVGTIE